VKTTPEELGYWFLRLNGFLTIPNFIVHPDDASGQHTDIDLIGVRFPFRSELLRNPMPDFPLFTSIENVPYIVFAEVKQGECGLNRALLHRGNQNVIRVLRAIGVFPEDDIEQMAECMYDNGVCATDNYVVSFLCIGDSENERLREQYPNIPQIRWVEIFDFFVKRFNGYRSIKNHHPQWDGIGKFLYNITAYIRDGQELYNYMQLLWRCTDDI